MKQYKSSPVGLYTIGIAALFLAGFFLLVILGARSYRNTVSVQSGNMGSRALLSYIATSAKANDTSGGLDIADGPEGQALIIADGDTGYALRIYKYNGSLVEDFAAVNAPLSPDSAMVIGATDKFTVDKTDAGVYSVATDDGRVLINPRSEGVTSP